MSEHSIQKYEAPKILGDVFEAIIGALYLDCGLAGTVKVMEPILAPVILFTAKLSKQIFLDPKEKLFMILNGMNFVPHFKYEKVDDPEDQRMKGDTTATLLSLKEA